MEAPPPARVDEEQQHESDAEVVEAAADCAVDLVELTGGSCFEALPDCSLGDCHVIDCHMVDCDPGCA